MFNNLIKHPTYIFKFALYLMFIAIAFVFYFSEAGALKQKEVKLFFSISVFLYGTYRLIRTYQDFKKEIRDESSY